MDFLWIDIRKLIDKRIKIDCHPERKSMLFSYKGDSPKMGKGCFIAPSAQIIGRVELGDGSSAWFSSSIRADINYVKIGKNVSIQDNCSVHCSAKDPVEIADDVVIGHNAIIHGTSIGSNTIIGMGAILLNGSKVGRNCIIGAGSVVTEGKEIPDNSIAMGTPAKVVKEATPEHIERIKRNVTEYSKLNDSYLEKGNFTRID
jgi:carbonic anhydrase/acetyltransferase-like protein (isoleucine patch superfamily)